MDDLLVMADSGYLTPHAPRPGSVAAKAKQVKADAAEGARGGEDGAVAAGRRRGAAVLHPDWARMSPAEARRRIAKRGHCSALIKVRRMGAA